MSQYIFILFWLGFMGVLASQKELKQTEVVCGGRVNRFPWWFAIIVFLPVIWMAGTRTYFGDTFLYRLGFLKIPDSLSTFSEYFQMLQKDKGYSVFAFLVKQVIGNKSVLYFTFVALLQAVLLISVYRKYSINYVMSVFLFIASTDYLSWMFNGIRQFTAVVIVFAATPWMLKKKYVQLVLIILLASTFHKTALIMLPCVVIAQGRAWNKKTLMFITCALLAVTFIGTFTSWMDSALSETQYANVVSDYKSWNDDGTSFQRVAVYSVPAILSFFGRKDIQRLGNPMINFCTNMSIISMGLYIISMFTSGIFIGRLPIYASLYSYILLPWEARYLFGRTAGMFVHVGIVVCFLIFYCFQLSSWSLL